MSPKVRTRCRTCEIPVPGDLLEGPVRCGRCSREASIEGPLPEPDQPVERCAVCGGRTFYIEKDVNRALGLALVVGAAIISAVIFYFNGVAGTLFLLVFALVDFGVYHLLPMRAVCYECLTEYVGWPSSDRHRPFDLDIYEGIRQRRLRAEEERDAANGEPSLASGGPSS